MAVSSSRSSFLTVLLRLLMSLLTLCEGLYVFGLRAFCQNLLGGKEVNTGSWDNERAKKAPSGAFEWEFKKPYFSRALKKQCIIRSVS
jgi:hypothetical protein